MTNNKYKAISTARAEKSFTSFLDASLLALKVDEILWNDFLIGMTYYRSSFRQTI